MAQWTRYAVFLGALALFGLGACSNDAQPPPPSQVDSGFDLFKHAFPFPNYGGGLNPQLTPDLVARMCGSELVCENGAIPCEIKPIPKRWMESTNRTLTQGRSEGFAMLSQMFFAGHLDPNDFGGRTTASLRLYQNTRLQEELSYWAATQSVPSATRNDVRYRAKDVIPYLARVLAPDSEEHVRLAIARKTEDGFAGGHALTPIGYYKGEGDIYWLRVYDNNFPQKERRLEINPEANTWRYEFPGVDGESVVYEGTSDNGNWLYFSTIEDRLGTLTCPFDPAADSHTLAYSGLTMVETAADGSQTGIVDGEVVESGQGRVTPAFSSCPRCGERVQVINQRSIAAGVSTLVVESTGDVVTTEEGEGAQITGTGPNYSATVSPEGSTKNDKASFGEDGSVTYESKSSESVKVASTRTRDDGSTEEVSVQVDGGSGEETVQVNVTRSEDGKAQVEVKGAPEGSSVTVVVENSNGESESVTYTSTGEDSSATVDPDSGDVTASNVKNLSGGSCINGILDAPNESDIDCGGTCNPCADDKTCNTDSDCQYERCVNVDGTGICQAALCENGIQDEIETDVDCGGEVCEPCTASDYNETSGTFFTTAPSCEQNSDCDSQKCVGARYGVPGSCVSKHEVILKLNTVGAWYTARQFSYVLDGVESRVRIDKEDPDGPYEIPLGQAYRYRLKYNSQSNMDCVSRNFSTFYTGKDTVADTELGGVIEISCADGAEAYLTGNIVYHDDVPPLPSSDAVRVEVSYDGNTSQTAELSGFLPGRDDRNKIVLGAYSDNWSAQIVGQPAGLYTNSTTGQDERVYCVIASGSGTFSTRDTQRSKLEVTCDWASKGTCDDGLLSTQFLQETDVDCGGKCDPCSWGKNCWSDSDCEASCVYNNTQIPNYSKICMDVSARYDGIQNQGETDVDCGGPINEDRCDDGESCNDHDDCVGLLCQNNTCAPRSCSDGVKNGRETGADCGGSGHFPDTCPDQKCPVGQGCLSNIDCATGYCDSGVCQSAPCADGVQNGLESDVDCGGPGCQSCPDASSCASNADCASGFCGRSSGVCETNQCTSGIKDGQETDVDCGGSVCYPCSDGKVCSVDSDCESGVCESGFCATASCSDGIENGSEIDVDCGGDCGLCAAGSYCIQGTDCASRICDANVCKEPSCLDRVQNGSETDVDCGGSCHSSCWHGETCSTDSDCIEFCDNGVCVKNTCDDGRKGRYEVDVDCGSTRTGAGCGRCAAGAACYGGWDCESTVCTNGVCEPATCDDGLTNGDETETDCGGPDCDGCAIGQPCNQGSDCESQNCEAGVCATSPCNDGVKNGDETDIDCGGDVCGSCDDGFTCVADDDCTSAFCNAGLCATPSCTDGIQNGDETDADCGGSSCNGCGSGDGCLADGDCTSSLVCTNDICVDPCANGVKDGDETDVDCGGSACSACANSAGCQVDADCTSGMCSANVCVAFDCSDSIQNGDETDVDCGGSNCGACAISAACTVDSDCATSDCECGASSGNCASASGTCGAGKLIADQPTTDGIATSATFTVPSQCNQVYVQAWGAAGAPGDSSFGANLGGAGGYVSGNLSVASGDVIKIWVGQGAETAEEFAAGTPGIGSNLGTLASGGQGHMDGFTFESSGGGGGLTSLQQTGSATTTFVVPGGAGGDSYDVGADVGAGSGGGALDSNGEDSGRADTGGGGAGAIGGATANAGTYGTLPSGLTSSDGTFGAPANTSAPDYSLCVGINASVGAGASGGLMEKVGGDGCVILRCVAP